VVGEADLGKPGAHGRPDEVIGAPLGVTAEGSMRVIIGKPFQ